MWVLLNAVSQMGLKEHDIRRQLKMWSAFLDTMDTKPKSKECVDPVVLHSLTMLSACNGCAY